MDVGARARAEAREAKGLDALRALAERGRQVHATVTVDGEKVKLALNVPMGERATKFTRDMLSMSKRVGGGDGGDIAHDDDMVDSLKLFQEWFHEVLDHGGALSRDETDAIVWQLGLVNVQTLLFKLMATEKKVDDLSF